nr:IS1 protein InsB [Enterobacteriaceae bacterium]
MYDGVFEVLPWLPSPSLVPPAQLLKAWCVTVKVLPDISAISALTAVKHGSYSSLTPPLRPQSVNSRIQPGSDVIVCAEIDEQWGSSALNHASAGCFTRMTGYGGRLLHTSSVNVLWPRWSIF